MNLIYAVTCLSVVGYLYHLYTVSKSNRARAEYFMSILERALPKLVPSLYPEEQTDPAQASGLPPGITPEMLAADAAKMQEHRMRQLLEDITGEILKAHNYQITFDVAHAKAEDIVVAMYACTDRPLSERIAKLVPTGTGESVAGMTPPKQAPQQTANLH